jgi:hypothetical protein
VYDVATGSLSFELPEMMSIEEKILSIDLTDLATISETFSMEH